MINARQQVTKFEFSINCCRVCLRKSSKHRSIFEPFEDGDLAPSEKLKKVAGIVVDQNDEKVPMVICKNCEISLNMAYTFRLTAIKSHDRICAYRSQIQQENDDILIVLENGRKFTLSKDITVRYCNNGNSYDLRNRANTVRTEVRAISVLDSNINNEDNSLEDRDESLINEESVQNDDYLEYSDTENSPCEVEKNSEEQISVESLQEKPGSPLDSNKYENTIHTLDSKNVYNPVEEKSKIEEHLTYELVKKQEILNESRSYSEKYICEKCGNIYSKKQRLLEHVKRHSTSKDFTCEICNKGFSVSESLRRHVLTHGAEKPYQCRFCSRKFFNPSSRKAHEIVHSGVKPHVCKECGSAFAYSCSLRKHLLIHEDFKLYYCRCCKKEFRLFQHLKQHEDTIIHKRALEIYMNE